MTKEGKQKLVSGALYDLMGFLTSRDEVLTLSANHNAAPACEALGEFAKLRGIDMRDPDIKSWNL